MTSQDKHRALFLVSNSAERADVTRSLQTHASEAGCDYCETKDDNQGSRVAHTKPERTPYVVTLRCSERTTYMVVSHVMQLVDFRLHAGHYSGSERNADM